jgi:branched-chain amino acid transport system permease protein
VTAPAADARRGRWAHPVVDAALILGACVVLPPVTSHAMPELLPRSLCLTLAIGVALAIAGLSANLLLGYAGQLSLGHAALLGVGAFAASLVVDRLELPMPFGLAAAAVVGGVVSLAIGLPALRLRGLYLALVTMVFGLTMQASVLRWQVFSGGSAGVVLPRRIVGDRLVDDSSVFLAICLVVLVAVWWIDRNVVVSRLGRSFRGIREDEVATASFGVGVTSAKLTAFVLSGAIAGVAGALYGHALGLVNSDNFSRELSLRIILIVVIGGIGRRWGVVAVALLLGLAPELPTVFQGYDLVIAAAVTLFNLIHLPGGLAGALSERVGRRRLAALAEQDPALTVLPDLAAVASTRPRPARPATDGTVPVLAVEGIHVSFGGLHAVEDVGLTVGERRIVGLIGPNGAGKSTFFGAVSGAVAADSGTVHLDGTPIHHLGPHDRAAAGIGRTFQLVGLARDQTVRENLLLAQHLDARYGIAAALLRTRHARRVEADLAEVADAVIDGLGFGHLAHLPVGSLSGGQQRIVEVAAVLATRPRLLMLDEPTAGLSPAAAETLAERLAQLRDDLGQSILLIEHNVPLVFALCDDVHVMAAGRHLASGTPDELARDDRVVSAYLGVQV